MRSIAQKRDSVARAVAEIPAVEPAEMFAAVADDSSIVYERARAAAVFVYDAVLQPTYWPPVVIEDRLHD